MTEKPRKKKMLFSIITFFISLIIILLFSEIFLRLVPIPGIRFDVKKYDTLTGGGFYPNSTNFYRNARGDFVKRKISKWGYYDKDFKREKKDNYTRIGFFGDSYTQAIQVPLNETFHNLIGEKLKAYNIETLSFGVSGYSTYQSYLTYTKWKDFFDIDVVVYVFFENDLGDQIKEIRKSPYRPYPYLKNDSLKVDNSFKVLRKNRTKFYFKFLDYLTSKSLLLSTLSERIQLLNQHGVDININNDNNFSLNAKKKTGETLFPPDLDVGDKPSVWPNTLKAKAINLEERVILNWKNQVTREQKEFIVLYIPSDIENPTIEQDTWKPWLEKFCKQNEITFIDPTTSLSEMKKSGNDVFYDHFTKFGHMAVAQNFTDWCLKNYVKK